jgi:hypothetical protein
MTDPRRPNPLNPFQKSAASLPPGEFTLFVGIGYPGRTHHPCGRPWREVHTLPCEFEVCGYCLDINFGCILARIFILMTGLTIRELCNIGD